WRLSQQNRRLLLDYSESHCSRSIFISHAKSMASQPSMPRQPKSGSTASSNFLQSTLNSTSKRWSAKANPTFSFISLERTKTSPRRHRSGEILRLTPQDRLRREKNWVNFAILAVVAILAIPSVPQVLKIAPNQPQPLPQPHRRVAREPRQRLSKLFRYQAPAA